MNLTDTVCISSSVFSQEIDGEMVLLDMKSENYFGLDSVATDIWQLLSEEKTLEETYSALIEMYEVEEVQLKEDLEAFIQKLLHDGLVTLA